MNWASLIRRMVDAGLSYEQALLAVECVQAEKPKAASGAERTRKWRERQKNAGDDVTSRASQASHSSQTSPRAQPNITTSENNNKNKGLNNISRAPTRETPRSELETVLDAEHATAVVEHRRRLGKALTPHAARLLAKRLGAQPDPNAAADTMIERGWLSFDPDWLTGRGGGRGPPRQAAPRRNGWVSLVESFDDARPDEPAPFLDLAAARH